MAPDPLATPVSLKTQFHSVGEDNSDSPLSPAPTEPEHDPQATTSITVNIIIDQIALLTTELDADQLGRSLEQALLHRGSTENGHIRDFALRLGAACAAVGPQEARQSHDSPGSRGTPQSDPMYTRLKIVTKKPDRSNDVEKTHTDLNTPTKDPAGSKSDGPKTRQSLRQTRRGTVDHAQHQHGAAFARHKTPQPPGVSQDTLVDLVSSLRSNQDRQSWTDGSEWQALIASGDGDKTRGSFKHAVTLICFANWHEAQVRLTVAASQVARSKATRSVSGRILGAKPFAADHARLWERRRSSLNTQLARGRKWARLVTEFTLGILLVNLWQLGKTSETDLDRLIAALHRDDSKKKVISLLQKQVDLLTRTGRTNETVFTSDLLCAELPRHNPIPEEKEKVEDFYETVQKSVDDAPLTVSCESFTFDPKALNTLAPNTWLNADVIMASLMVADRLPWVRVGISVPIHCGGVTLRNVRRPFQVTASKIDGWRQETTEKLVFFFVLFQRSNHFSLLEINDRTNTIHHYDSMSGVGEENTDIKAACAEEFPKLEYSEERVPQQEDVHSCGLFVMKTAQLRGPQKPSLGMV
ncbi:hypothetical protein PLICBS_001177 [Purpureocillium lilacinum]|uniref:uncharacterized protein n=1 Tax=Purpureocillium lilacinum TaxID=33203 RepID=UPI00208D57FA|nr:hypothetical protein PLICBS_001177 [Purpureocillium lilacinum]